MNRRSLLRSLLGCMGAAITAPLIAVPLVGKAGPLGKVTEGQRRLVVLADEMLSGFRYGRKLTELEQKEKLRQQGLRDMGWISDDKLLFRVIADGREYCIYTSGAVTGFNAERVLIFNRFLRQAVKFHNRIESRSSDGASSQ